MRIVCLSDTHCLHEEIRVPDGDLLIHAGDVSGRGSADQIGSFTEWFGALPHRHKVLIAGNHDHLFEQKPQAAKALVRNAVYLCDGLIEIEGLRIWGSPWQPKFFDWAFNLPRGKAIRAKWDLIPQDIDILVTHGPPAGHGDLTDRDEAVGCVDLLAAVRRVRPRLHVFGHIHEGYGITREGGTTFVNASNCDVRYRPVNAPLVLEWAELDRA